MTLQDRLSDLATAIGADIKSLTAAQQSELASVTSNLAFTHTTAGTFADVPGMTMLVPAGIPWVCEMNLTFQMKNGATPPANGANTYMQAKVVDVATGNNTYCWGMYQVANNAVANNAWYGMISPVQVNDPLPTDTVLKVMINSSGNTGMTFSLYQVSNVAGGAVARAARR